MRHSRSRWWLFAGVIALAMVALLVMPRLLSTGRSQAPTTPSLPIVATSAGMTVSLTNVELAADRTVLTFSIVDADTGSGPALAQLDAPAPTDLRLDGLSWHSASLGNLRPIFSNGAGAQQITAWELSLVFDPITEPAREVSATITALRFRPESPEERGQILEGDWSFRFTPAALGAPASSQLTVDQQHSADGITFFVDAIMLAPTHATVTYRIASQSGSNFESTEIMVQLADGTQLMPKQIDNHDGAFVATFPPFPAGATLTIALAPILVEVSQPLTLTFPIDGRSIASAAEGTQVDLHTPLVVAGEQFEVASVTIQEKQFVLRIQNTVPDHRGSLLLRYPGENGVTLTDNLGNQYAFSGASTNFGKSDPLTSWADGSSFAFTGAIAAEASQLTLTLDGYARQARGPWQITVQLPAAP